MENGPKRDIEYADVVWKPNDYEWMDYPLPLYTDERGRFYNYNGPGGERYYIKGDGPGER